MVLLLCIYTEFSARSSLDTKLFLWDSEKNIDENQVTFYHARSLFINLTYNL